MSSMKTNMYNVHINFTLANNTICSEKKKSTILLSRQYFTFIYVYYKPDKVYAKMHLVYMLYIII